MPFYLIPLVSVGFITGCSNDTHFKSKNFNSEIQSDNKVASANNAETDSPAQPPAQSASQEEASQSEASESVDPEGASVPTSVTGVYLGCSFSESGHDYFVNCKTDFESTMDKENDRYTWSYQTFDELTVDFEIILESNPKIVKFKTPKNDDLSIEILRKKLKITLAVSNNGEMVFGETFSLTEAPMLEATEEGEGQERPEEVNLAATLEVEEENEKDGKTEDKKKESPSCWKNWRLILGDPDYGTKNFCVMRFEAKKVNDKPESRFDFVPWTGISQIEAIAACKSLGHNARLISNAEWMTIAGKIASTGANWQSNTPGEGAINRGHSDHSPLRPLEAHSNNNNSCFLTEQNCDLNTWHMQRRTHKLPSGIVIWDFAGNVWEWTTGYYPNGKATPSDQAWYEFTAVEDGTKVKRSMMLPVTKSFYSSDWDSTLGIGQYYGGREGSGGVLRRGGSYWNHEESSGIYTAGFLNEPSHKLDWIGFRCVKPPLPKPDKKQHNKK